MVERTATVSSPAVRSAPHGIVVGATCGSANLPSRHVETLTEEEVINVLPVQSVEIRIGADLLELRPERAQVGLAHARVQGPNLAPAAGEFGDAAAGIEIPGQNNGR